MKRTLALAIVLLVVLATAGCVADDPSDANTQNATTGAENGEDCTVDDPRAENPATVALTDDGEQVATITAAVSDDSEERYVGLSSYDCLPEDEGMLFVYDRPSDHTYVMRNMDFAIDIVYVDANGCVTSVHAAEAPGPDEDGEDQEYPGYGQYVVEVPMGVASDAGVEEGDPVRIEHDGTVVDGTANDCFDS